MWNDIRRSMAITFLGAIDVVAYAVVMTSLSSAVIK